MQFWKIKTICGRSFDTYVRVIFVKIFSVIRTLTVTWGYLTEWQGRVTPSLDSRQGRMEVNYITYLTPIYVSLIFFLFVWPCNFVNLVLISVGFFFCLFVFVSLGFFLKFVLFYWEDEGEREGGWGFFMVHIKCKIGKRFSKLGKHFSLDNKTYIL